jgi:MFS family permease
MQQTDKDGFLISKKYSWYVFGLLYLLYLFDYIDRLVISALFPYLKAEWGISDTQCGLLISAVYWSIIIFSFPISILIDRWSRKKSIAIMAVFWSMATIAAAFTTSFKQLFITRTAIGIGEAGYAPGGTAMISALFPEKKRAMIMGLWNSSIPLGSALGIVIGGFIAANYGWRHALGIVAIPGLFIAILFFFVKDYKTVELKIDEANKKQKMKKMDIVREFLGKGSLIFTYFGFAGCTFVTSSLLSWLPSYYNRMENLPIQQASMKASAVMLLAIIGAPLGGFLADRWMRKRENARPLFSSISTLAAAVIMFITFSFLEGKAQYALLLAVGVTLTMFIPAAAAVTQDVVHPGLRAISYSLCVIVQNLLGSSLGPVVTGYISDQSDILTALKTLPIFLLIAALLFFIGSFFYNRDLAKVQRVELKVE